MAPPSKALKFANTLLPFIHEDIITNHILPRLPTRSVGRFRCVSKSWRSLLSSPGFARAHLNIHMDHEYEVSILKANSHPASLYTVNLANESCTVSAKLTIPSCGYAILKSSCHGLVLVHGCKKDSIDVPIWLLLNPITLETVEISIDVKTFTNTFGLGYDSLHDDYKIVWISEDIMPHTSFLSIYSVKRKTWAENVQVHHQSFDGNGLFVNGRIHWLASASDEINIVKAFNVSEEKFEDFQLPKGFNVNPTNHNDKPFLTLIVLEGCLAMKVSYECVYHFWVMKVYGVQDSWTKIIKSYTYKCPHSIDVVGVLGENAVFLNKQFKGKDKQYQSLVSYNLRGGGAWGNMINAELPRISASEVMNFRESLISPNNF